MTDARTIEVCAGDARYGVHIDGRGRALEAARAHLAGVGDAVALVQDARVAELHGALLTDTPTLDLDGGEGVKELDVLGRVLDFCASASLSRRSALASYGGGTIGDLTGLAASLFKRGLDVVHVPTTLLAQVDSSVGGKTAINLRAGKNLAGTFHHPGAVFCDTSVLATLEDADLRSGFGEVVKTMLLAGDADLAALEERTNALIRRDEDALGDVVARCVEVKRDVVEADPDERGPRRALNLGHTFGHAIERVAGFGTVPHGVAVAVGLGLAADASADALDADPELADRIRTLLSRLGLPTSLDALRDEYGVALPADGLREALRHDKKGAVGQPEFVLLRAPGDAALGVPLEDALLARLFA
ncbi:MAG: 3-dehydroquinate synthase family protein [Planctomycetota bacterium]